LENYWQWTTNANLENYFDIMRSTKKTVRLNSIVWPINVKHEEKNMMRKTHTSNFFYHRESSKFSKFWFLYRLMTWLSQFFECITKMLIIIILYNSI
jgi:hypothetical protein